MRDKYSFDSFLKMTIHISSFVESYYICMQIKNLLLIKNIKEAKNDLYLPIVKLFYGKQMFCHLRPKNLILLMYDV